MVAETAAQFNSPLWQIENYSLVPPAGAINCVRQRRAAGGRAASQERLKSLVAAAKLCDAGGSEARHRWSYNNHNLIFPQPQYFNYSLTRKTI